MLGRRTTLVAALVATGMLAAASTAQAAERRCEGAIGPETVHDDLVVPAGQVCDLAGTRVLGNTRVEEAAELFAEQAELAGNLDAARAGYVDLFETTVAGTVRLNESLGLSVEDGSVGNVDSRAADFLDLFGAKVAGNVKVTGGETAVFGEGSGRRRQPGGHGRRLLRSLRLARERDVPGARQPSPGASSAATP